MGNKTKRVLFLGTDGELRLVDIDKGAGLKPYYDLIGTDIVEGVYLPNTQVGGGKTATFEGYADEEGYFHRQPFNALALYIFGRELVGPVVVWGRSLDKLVSYLTDSGYALTGEDEPDYDDWTPPDFGPPGSGAVVTEYYGDEPGLEEEF